MNAKRKQSFLTRALVLVMAFAMAVLMFPTDALTVLFANASLEEDVDHTFITIGEDNKDVKTSVVKGGTYTIPKAYIGGNEEFAIGTVENETSLSVDETVKLNSSSVTVTYNGAAVKVNDAEGEKNFTADNVGTYTVEYSYTVTDGTNAPQTFKYTLQVYSSLASATINFDENDEKLFPSIIDAQLLKDNNLYLAEPTILNKNGEEVFNTLTDVEGNETKEKVPVVFEEEVADLDEKITDYVVVSVFDPVVNGKLAYDAEAETPKIGKDDKGLYISNATLKEHAGEYKVTYRYFKNHQFVISTERTTRVYADNENERYYKDYAFTAKLATSWSDSAQTGVEANLPVAVGQTSDSTTPANEKIDVYYKVKVRYKASNSESYKNIADDATKRALYNNDSENPVFDENGYLVDPTKFTPLDNGNYEFIYEVTDFYNTETKTIGAGVYEFTDVKDQTNPTVVVYDASDVDSEGKPTFENASYKAKRKSYPNSVVVYAIHIDDNVSTDADLSKEGSKMEMYRDIKTSSTNSIYKIEKYNDKNLVFNYRATDVGTDAKIKAYKNLQTYNYLIRKHTADVNSDAQMLKWLNEHGYMIVVDNKNFGHIYDIFSAEEKLLDTDASNPLKAEGITKENSIDWFKSAAAEKYGFAYLDMDFTFGYNNVNDGGRSETQYYIQYYVKDQAERYSSTTLNFVIDSELVDYEAPTINFSSTLSDYYLPTATVTFNEATVSDNIDTNMKIHTLYRYLDDNDKPISIEGKTAAKFESVVEDITKYAEANNASSTFYSTLQKDKEKFLTKDLEESYNYYELESKNSSYVIDLKEAGDTAKKLQVLVYAYDDEGNLNLYTKESTILNEVDNKAPVLDPDTTGDQFVQDGNDITIPQVVISDDLINYVTFDVEVVYVDKNQTITASGFNAQRKHRIGNTGILILNGGKFNASYAGTYNITVSFKDSKNRTVAKFFTIEVEESVTVQNPPAVQDPHLESTTYDAEELFEFDEEKGELIAKGIEIPVPKVNYDIENSVTEDIFFDKDGSVKLEYQKPDAEPPAEGKGSKYNDAKYVVIGVDENHNSKYWTAKDTNPAGMGETNVGNRFEFNTYLRNGKQEYIFNIVYETTTLVYNFHDFTLTDETDGTNLYVFDGTISVPNNDEPETNKDYGLKIIPITENQYKVIKKSEDVTRYITRKEDGTYFITDEIDDNRESSDPFLDGDKRVYDKIFAEVGMYQSSTKAVPITITDKTAPEIVEDDRYDEVKYLSVADLKDKYKNKINIYGMQLNAPLNDVDYDECSISISCTLADGSTPTCKIVVPKPGDETKTQTAEGKDFFGNEMFFDGFGDHPDGTYTIKYQAKDKFGTSASREYVIKVGDTTPPAMIIPDNYVKTSYDINDAHIEIDLDKLSAYDAVDGKIEKTVEFVSLYNTSTSTSTKIEEAENSTERVKIFDLTEVGSYELTLQVKDKVGNTETRTIKFEVTAAAENPVPVYQIVGTVLIVVSVLLLAGVIIYFIVSKVKLDKELKK